MGLFDDEPPKPKPALTWSDTNAKNTPQKQSPRFEIETGVPAPQPKAAKTTDIETRTTVPPQLREWPIPTADFKPGIDMAIAVFRNYLRVMSPGEMSRALHGNNDAEAYEALATRHKEQLRNDLEGLGLAQYINFNE